MDGQFECKIYENKKADQPFECKTSFGTFGAASYSAAIVAAAEAAKTILGGGTGTWVPFLRMN